MVDAGRRARFSDGFSLSGAFGDTNVVPGLRFTNDDAANDFTGGLSLRGPAGSWPGVPTATLTAVRAALGRSQKDPRLALLAQNFLQAAQPFADDISRNLQPFGLGGRSETQDSQYKAAMQAIVDAMTKYVSDEQIAKSQIEAEAAKTSSLPGRPDGGAGARSGVAAMAKGAIFGIRPIFIIGAVVGLGALFFFTRRRE